MKTLSSIDVIDSLSLNLSGQSVGDRAFHGWAFDMLAEMGPAMCSKLRLEITETAVVTNLADAAIFIQTVRAAWVKVALENFGAGVSSSGHLKALSALAAARAAEAAAIASCKKRISDTTIDVVAA